jgi:hypothetical protein
MRRNSGRIYFPYAESESTPFLNPGAAGVVQPDKGTPGFQRQVHYLADFSGMHFSQASCPSRKILGKSEYRSAADAAKTGDYTVGGNFDLYPCRNERTGALHDGPVHEMSPDQTGSPTFSGSHPSRCFGLMFFNSRCHRPSAELLRQVL